MDEIIEAMENSALSRKSANALHSHCPDKADCKLWRDRLMRFLEPLDDDLTVGEIKAALEEYE